MSTAAEDQPDLSRLELEPGVLEWISRLREVSERLPGLSSGELEQHRHAASVLADVMALEFTLPAPYDVEIDELTVHAGWRDHLVRRYVPRGIGQGPRPTQVFLHGGGFIKGSPRELHNDRLLAARARGAGVQILSLRYPLAPEHPYPAARDTLIEVMAALFDDPGATDADAARLGIGGNSAGAAIVATAVLKWCAEGGAPLVHQSLEVPAVALKDFGESYELYGHGFGLDGIDELSAMILPDGAADEYASPLEYVRACTRPPAGYPPTLVMTAEYDPLRDTGESFARELERLDVPVALVRGERQLHGSSSVTAASEGARLWQRRAASELRTAYHPTPSLRA